MRDSRRCLTSIVILLSLMVAGCATLGPAYSKADKIPENTGLVYFYRPSSFFGGGIVYDIRSGDAVITTLHNGGYYPYFSAPGEREFWARTESKSSVTLDIVAGQVYYVKGEVGVGFIAGRPHLMVIDPVTAEKEIADCKLIPEKK